MKDEKNPKPHGPFTESRFASSRRDLLKFFGAGTLIAPLAGGATARLIEPPKAEIIIPDNSIVNPFRPNDIVSAHVSFQMGDGSIRQFEADPPTSGSPSTTINRNRGGYDFLREVHLTVLIERGIPGSPQWMECVTSVRSVGVVR